MVRQIFFIFLLLIIQKIKSDESNEQKYYFQLYPSLDQEEPYYLYAQNNKNIMVINSTDGENMNIIEKEAIQENKYGNISSVYLIDDDYLVKTCFGPNKLMEVQNKNKGKFIYFYNNFEKIKYCYSTKIYNPYINKTYPDEYVIITYWTEIDENNKEKYCHKSILFYPQSNSFGDELILSSGEKFNVNLFYPEKCDTFQNFNIFCVIHFSPESSDDTRILGNHYIIETKYLLLDAEFHKNSSIYLVYSNSKLTAYSYLVPISLNKIVNIPLYGKGSIYITQYHDYKEDGSGKTLFLYSYYIKNNYRISYVSYYESLNYFYGINIQDIYINPNLFNHLFVNGDELIVLYIFKDIQTSLFLTRFNVTSDINHLHKGFKNVSSYTYRNIDICEDPKSLKSIYINSFIKYDNKDKIIINENSNKNYYKYKKDIGVLISCSENNEVTYKSIKIDLPQCLNTLDEINGNSRHIIKFDDSHTEEIFDLYGDPNLFSLRNVEINFIPSKTFSFLFLMQIKINGENNFKNITYNVDYKNVSHIKFIRKYSLSTKPIILNYRLKQNVIIKEKYVSRLISDFCELSFEINNNNEKCDIDFCEICKNKETCQICSNITNAELLNDENIISESYGKCICNENKGFKKIPNNKINMCICKDDYSFYRDTEECKSNEELKNMPTYINDKDEISGIDIYEDCYYTCKKCSKGGFSYDEQNCDECKEGYILEGNNCYDPDDLLEKIENNICLLDKKIWFKLGEYIFYYLKIDKCIYIYDGDILFFISNKNDCLDILNNPNNTYRYISGCLNNYLLNNKYNYNNFINNAKEYIPNANNLTIYKYSENEKFYFHLYNDQMKYNNISSIYLEGNETIDLLIFKVDIKRKDTISTQVEYQFYNPIPQYIYQTIDINKYLLEKNDLLKNNFTNNYYEYIYLDLPISWPDDVLEKIKELYKNNINPFDSKSDFYLDVCYKYTTPNNDDIYLQERKKVYYPDYPFCEEKCTFIKFNLDTNKITCKCKPKTNSDNYDKVLFQYNYKDENFKKKYIFPNLRVMKCTNIIVKTLYKNLGFFVTLLFLVNFFLCILQRLYLKKCFYKKKENLPIIDDINSINEELKKADVNIDENITINISNSSFNGDNNNSNNNNVIVNNNKAIDNNDNNNKSNNAIDNNENCNDNDNNNVIDNNKAIDNNGNKSKANNNINNKAFDNNDNNKDTNGIDNNCNNKYNIDNNCNNNNGNNNNRNNDNNITNCNELTNKINVYNNKKFITNINYIKKNNNECNYNYNGNNINNERNNIGDNNNKLILKDNSKDCQNKKVYKKKDNISDKSSLFFSQIINSNQKNSKTINLFQNHNYDFDGLSKSNLINSNKSTNKIENTEVEETFLVVDCDEQKSKPPKYRQNYMERINKVNIPFPNPPKKPRDSIIITKISFYTLSLSFFIFLNIFFAFNMSMLHIYYKFKFWCFLLNLLVIPFILSSAIILFKKYICHINMENSYIIADIFELLFLIEIRN